MSTHRSVNDALPHLAMDLMTVGADVPSRAGATKELTFKHITLTHPLEREIVVPARKANLAAQIAETAWVLAGRNDVDWLAHYLPRAAEFSDDGATWRAGYGPRLRSWRGPVSPNGMSYPTDQFQSVIALLLGDPTTRRAVMSIWDPAADVIDSKDIPCNNWLHFLARDGVLNLHVAIRSNDLVWGWSGINQFEWSTLLEIVAAYAGLTVGRIHYAVSSLHMYDRHWDASRHYRVSPYRETSPTPRFTPGGGDLDGLLARWFSLEERIRAGENSRPVLLGADIDAFPEPMLRSWLRVLQWWWGGDVEHLRPLRGTRLAAAARVAVQPKPAAPAGRELAAAALKRLGLSPFIEEVTRLHNEKHAAYGDSWRKRGELFSILPNIARKVDRLGSTETTDENATDTAVDLMVYLAKYRTWLDDQKTGRDLSDNPDAANGLLRRVSEEMSSQEHPWTTTELEDEQRVGLEDLMLAAVDPDQERHLLVDHLLRRAYVLASRRWRDTPALFARSVDEYRGADHE